MGSADNSPPLKRGFRVFLPHFPRRNTPNVSLVWRWRHIGVRCSERRIGCLFFFYFSSLIFCFPEKKKGKKEWSRLT